MAHLLFAVAFPFKARSFMIEYPKMVHIAGVIVVLVLGSLPGIIVLSISKYHIDGFPPNVCYPSIKLFFHTFVLPLAIQATVGLAMLFIVFTIIRRVSAVI